MPRSEFDLYVVGAVIVNVKRHAMVTSRMRQMELGAWTKLPVLRIQLRCALGPGLPVDSAAAFPSKAGALPARGHSIVRRRVGWA